MSKLRIYVVRHGQTDENAKGILCGQTVDGSINQMGIDQAHEVAQALRHVEFDTLYSSTMKRAQETAAIIAADLGGMSVVEDARLRERDYGSLAGRTWEGNFGEEAELRRKNDTEQRYDYRPYGGESAKQVIVRVLASLADIKATRTDPVVVVAHGGVLKALKKHFEGDAYDRMPNNGTILTLDI